MYKSLLGLVLSMLFTVACSDDITTAPNDDMEPKPNHRAMINAKADDTSGVRAGEPADISDSQDQHSTTVTTDNGATADDGTVDACAYFRFYDDGTCEPGCPKPDPDCARGAPVSDRLEFLCGPPVGQPDGLCLMGCPGEDPDCSAQATQDQCEGDYSDRDGLCNPVCFPDDEDCIAQGDICFSEYRYGDGACDVNCAFPDPDCSNTPLPADALEDWERDFCSRTVQREESYLAKELATSVCIDRTPSQLPTCVASCLNAVN